MIVKWADTERERQARRLQKVQSHVSRPDPQNPSMFGALPMAYVPPYNGYGYHVSSCSLIYLVQISGLAFSTYIVIY